MHIIENPWRGEGLRNPILDQMPFPSENATAPEALLARCPEAAQTPMAHLGGLGAGGAVRAHLWLKDERTRMGLGSFKALGAAYVIAHAAQRGDISAQVYVTASAGNHGLSVAAGARVFGAQAVIYLARTVPESFAARLQDEGAKVVRAGDDYEASMQAAAQAATENGWVLLSDSSWEGYSELPHRLMEGYLAMAAEAIRQMPVVPTHILLQAGVGGLAGACAALFRRAWGDAPRIIVVEPDAAPALAGSIQAGRAVAASGPVSCMGRLDCKEPSLIALKGLSRDADQFITISEAEAQAVLPALAEAGFETSASGGAGVAAVWADAAALDIDAQSQVLCIISEEPAGE